MKKTILFFLFIFLSLFSFSQTDKNNQRPKDIKDNPEYLKALEMEKSKGNAIIQVSEYFGLESKITNVLVNDFIPSVFPKSLGYSDKNKYIDAINSWLTNNQSFVKANKKDALISE